VPALSEAGPEFWKRFYGVVKGKGTWAKPYFFQVAVSRIFFFIN
jgi:hypothetical protein